MNKKMICTYLSVILCTCILTGCSSTVTNSETSLEASTSAEELQNEIDIYAQIEYPAATRTYSVEELIVDWSRDYVFYPYFDDIYQMYQGDLSGLVGFYNIKTNEILVEPTYEMSGLMTDDGYQLAYRDDGKTFVVLDEYANELMSVEDVETAAYISEGMVKVGFDNPNALPNVGGSLYSIYTVNGELIISDLYASIGDCSGGYIPVSLIDSADENGDFFVSIDGEITYLENCSFIGNNRVLSDGLILVNIDGGSYDYYGYADTSGKVVLSDTFYYGYSFSNQRTFVKKDKDDKVYYMIDPQGNEITPAIYTSAESTYNELFVVTTQDNTGYGIIDCDGNEVLPPIYYKILVYENGFIQADYNDDASESLSYEENSNRKIYSVEFDRDLNSDITKSTDYFFYNDGTLTQYDGIYDFSEGFAKVEKDSLYGFIDENGNLIADTTYKYAEAFSSGMAMVWLNQDKKACGYVDTNGDLAILCTYSDAGDFSNGLACVVTEDQRCIIIDRQGNEVYELEDADSNPLKWWTNQPINGGLMYIKYSSSDLSDDCMRDIYGNVAIDEAVYIYPGMDEVGFIVYDNKLTLIYNPLLLD